MEHEKKIKVKKLDKSKIINLAKGKIPPQAVDTEEVILGAMLIDKKGVDSVIDILNAEVFYKEAHQKIYKAIYDLFLNSESIDLLTVSDKLKKNGNLESVGGEFYLIQLTQKVGSSAHIEFHSRIIIQKYIQRKLTEVLSEIVGLCYEETSDVFELLDKVETKLFEITEKNIKKSIESSSGLVKQAIDKIKGIGNKEGISGLETGFKKIDYLTSGLQDSDLIIIAGRPGMGKTAFAISMVKNMAINFNYPVAFFSLEMSSIQLINRMISIETGLSSEKLRKGNLEQHEWEQLYVKVEKLIEAPIFIDDTPSLSILDLRAKARRLMSKQEIKIIVIDYIQLMTTNSDKSVLKNREQEISFISRSVKSLAKELNIPIIALSQLSRAVETRGGSKRPLLSDLRESGAIEQDADIVSFIYRPEYYGFEEWDDDERTPCEGQAEFIVAKHRNGGMGNMRLRFTKKLAKFSNLEEENFEREFESKMNNFNRKKTNTEDAFGDSKEDTEENPFPF